MCLHAFSLHVHFTTKRVAVSMCCCCVSMAHSAPPTSISPTRLPRLTIHSNALLAGVMAVHAAKVGGVPEGGPRGVALHGREGGRLVVLRRCRVAGCCDAGVWARAQQGVEVGRAACMYACRQQ